MPDNRPLADGERVLADLNALRAIGAYNSPTAEHQKIGGVELPKFRRECAQDG